MRIRYLVLSGLAAVAMLLAACAPQAAADSTPDRTITVTGSSQVFVKPDIAYISIGVHNEDEDIAKAVDDNSRMVEAVIQALKETGIADEDLRTTNFNIWYMDKYSPTGERQGVSYAVDNTVYVTVRQLDQMGQILKEAVSAGANNIYGIQFDLADKSQALSTGRLEAVSKAETQAQELAGAAGLELGEIQSMTYYGSAYPTPYYGGIGGGGGEYPAEAIAPSIAPGQLTLQVDVTIVYTLK